jgi:hypothetical protein
MLIKEEGRQKYLAACEISASWSNRSRQSFQEVRIEKRSAHPPEQCTGRADKIRAQAGYTSPDHDPIYRCNQKSALKGPNIKFH